VGRAGFPACPAADGRSRDDRTPPRTDRRAPGFVFATVDSSLRSEEGDRFFSTREVASTRPLPCARLGNRSQPKADGFRLFLQFVTLCDLRPVATDCNHGSIKAPSAVAKLGDRTKSLRLDVDMRVAERAHAALLRGAFALVSAAWKARSTAAAAPRRSSASRIRTAPPTQGSKARVAAFGAVVRPRCDPRSCR
jgi:hypothetical protein